MLPPPLEAAHPCKLKWTARVVPHPTKPPTTAISLLSCIHLSNNNRRPTVKQEAWWCLLLNVCKEVEVSKTWFKLLLRQCLSRCTLSTQAMPWGLSTILPWPRRILRVDRKWWWGRSPTKLGITRWFNLLQACHRPALSQARLPSKWWVLRQCKEFRILRWFIRRQCIHLCRTAQARALTCRHRKSTTICHSRDNL